MRTHAWTRVLPLLLFATVIVAGAPTAKGASAWSEDQPDRRRLLTLGDGSIERLRSRTVEGVWEYRDGPKWQPLGREVLEHRLLKEAVAEAESLARDVKKNDHTQRAELARWMANEGLYEESIVELSRVLRADPEHSRALKVIQEVRIPIELSEEAKQDPAVELKEILLAGSGGTPGLMEVAVRRLEEFQGRTDLYAVLDVELRRPQNQRRAFAARALRRLYPNRARQALTARTLLDGFEDVRTEAAYGLRGVEDVGVIMPAIDALTHQHSAVRSNAAQALGNMGFQAAVEPLVNHLANTAATGGGNVGTRANLFAGLETAYVQDFDVEIAQGASIAKPIVRTQTSGVVFDVRTTVQLTQVIEMQRTMRSLRQLTGQNFRNDPAKWAKWWASNQDDWRATDKAKAFEARKLAAARASGSSD